MSSPDVKRTPNSGEQTKFLITGVGRCGTTWLAELLNSHPDIYCQGEIFNFENIFFREMGLPSNTAWLKDPDDSLELFYERFNTTRASGFKILPNQAGAGFYARTLERPEIKKIVMCRRNLLRLHVSGKNAQLHGTWWLGNREAETFLRRQLYVVFDAFKDRALLASWRAAVRVYRRLRTARKFDGGYAPTPLTIDTKILLQHFDGVQKIYRELSEKLQNEEYFLLYYEDLCGPDSQDWLKKIQGFLNVEPQQLVSSSIRLHGGPLTDLIANYQEVCAALKGTEYERFLDPDYDRCDHPDQRSGICR